MDVVGATEFSASCIVIGAALGRVCGVNGGVGIEVMLENAKSFVKGS